MAQQVKDPMLSLQRYGSLLRRGFSPWPRNFHVQRAQPKKNCVAGGRHFVFYDLTFPINQMRPPEHLRILKKMIEGRCLAWCGNEAQPRLPQ